MKAIHGVVAVALGAGLAFGVMADTTGKKNNSKVVTAQPVSMVREDLRLTLTAVDMQRQGGDLQFSDRARKLLADYAN